MELALSILAVQTLLGALDNVLHHEVTERLPDRASARHELTLHAAREAIYGVLFLTFAWCVPFGLFAVAAMVLLATEAVITMADFLEEDRTRRLPPFERVLHTVLTLFYGVFLALMMPLLWANAFATSNLALTSYGALSVFFTAAAVGVWAFAVRNALAVIRLGRLKAQTVQVAVAPSGRTVLVTGATGFIGRGLVARLVARGDRVIVLARDRRQAVQMFGADVLCIEALETLPRETRITAIVNLAGAPIIGLPWTRGRRAAIWRSRIDLTDGLVKWMATLDRAPRALISGSAIGVYGDRGDDLLGEHAGEGKGFAASLCRVWEDAAMKAERLGVRVSCLRIGVVIDRNGGAFPMMALPARFGLGAVFGNGRQWMSVIDREDLLSMIETALGDLRWSGPVNAVALEAATNRDFQKAIAAALRRPLFLAAPAWGLRLLLGEMSTIFLHSQRVVPARAAELGFVWRRPTLMSMLSASLGPVPSSSGVVSASDCAATASSTGSRESVLQRTD